MRRTTLTADQQRALQEQRRDPTLPPRDRDRLEMILLSAANWSPPRIAEDFACSAKRVRAVLDRFAAEGVTAVRRRHPGPPPDSVHRAQVTAALSALLGQDRSWTAAQLSAALGEQDIRLSARQTRKYLAGIAAWRRTVRTLGHKQSPVRVARAERQLGVLQKKGAKARSRSVTSTAVASAPVSP